MINLSDKHVLLKIIYQLQWQVFIIFAFVKIK